MKILFGVLLLVFTATVWGQEGFAKDLAKMQAAEFWGVPYVKANASIKSVGFDTEISTDLDEMLDSLFRGKSCFERSGVALRGQDRTIGGGMQIAQTGTFTGGADVIGLDRGIMLTTGFTFLAPGPNSPLPASGSSPAATQVVDADVAALLGAGTPYFDAAILEFTFTPTTDSISFDYVFFSEEYCSGINNAFGSDVFAVILDGPEGRSNIATLENGDLVSPFNLNHVKTPQLYVDNTPPGSVDDCAGGPIDPAQLAAINYNGFSKPLRAKAKVTPCATYTIKIIVADAIDAQLDSGVFLKLGSLTKDLIEKPVVTPLPNLSSVALREGCDTAFITFNRLFNEAEDLAKDQLVNFSFAGGGGDLSMATPGLDYLAPASPVTIPAGATSITIALPILSDALAEGQEALIIDYDGLCNCSSGADTLYLEDTAPLSISLDGPTSVCVGTTAMVRANAAGGDGNYTFNWPDGLDGDTRNFTVVGVDTTLEVSVTDGCGGMTMARITIDNGGTTASFGAGPYSLCGRSSVSIPLSFTGTAPYLVSVRQELAGTATTMVYSISNDTSFVFTQPGSITLLSVTDANGCTGSDLGSPISIIDEPVQFTQLITEPTCAGSADGAITIVPSASGPGNLVYSWSDGGPNSRERTGLPAGNYSVTVSTASDASCFKVEQFSLNDPDPILERRRIVTAQDCRAGGSIEVAYQGGRGALAYAWSNGATTADIDNLPAGNYGLTVTDTAGCVATETFLVTDLRSTPDATISATGLELNCARPSVQLSAPAAAPDLVYAWTNSAGSTLSTTSDLNTSIAGEFFLTVQDTTNGCSSTQSVIITQSPNVFSIELPAERTLTCRQPTTTLVPTLIAGVDFEWYLDGALISRADSLVDLNIPGEYELRATRQSDGCESIATTTLLDGTALPMVAATNPLVSKDCRSETVTLATVGAGPYAYRWTNGAGAVINGESEPSLDVAVAGQYVAVVTDTITGCSANLSFTVTDDGPTVTPDAGPDVAFDCAAAGTRLEGSTTENLRGTEYRWTNLAGNELANGRSFVTEEPGTYVLETIHPISGCSSFDTVTVIDDGPTAAEFAILGGPCPEVGGELSLLNVSGGTAPYEISSVDGFTDAGGSTLQRLPAGPVSVFITDARGCELDTLVTVPEPSIFTGTAPNLTVRFGEEVSLGASTNRDSSILQYRWTNLPDTLACTNCTEPKLRPLSSFTALVEVTDDAGCQVQIRQQVFVEKRDLIYLPTAFSPADGNGVNDVYVVFGDAEFVDRVRQFVIYDRWGNKVFDRTDFAVNDQTQGWNGETADGQAYPTGVYAYAVEVVLFDGTVELLKGSFTLLR
ncbi:choice-of-anchor L domain-containing protein [Lewinella sp. 4G2]|uniref:choice-of-anchor L domain-containing protein n=1 Tax=Lewinella sp. 4G2 TaxID=1803372 RepID=UPI0007B4F694|nr:choice-of-anchor L domain-containing protein [Lewinella sp. 4G2]OAV45434.1 hypothetical protein A3850_013445 [Lewinella sp. 4G2]